MSFLVFLATSAGAYLLTGFILLGALGGFLYLNGQYGTALRDIHAARKKLESVAPEHFAASFDTLSDWFAEHGPLREIWKHFHSTLTYTHDDTAPLRRTLPSDAFFNGLAVLPLYVNLRFSQYLPSALTGVGIFFTFVGLAIGIHLANAGLMASSLEEMRASLSHLLGGASTAFLTSIGGLFSSLLVSFVTQARENRITNECRSLSVLLDERVPSTSAEALATELVKEARLQRNQLERFNSEFALSLVQALDERFAARLTPKLEELISSVGALREERSLFNHDALAHLVDRFEESVTGAAGKELQALASTVREIGGSLAGVKDALVSEREGMSRALQSGLAAFEGGLKSLGAEVSGAALPIAEAAERWTTTLNQAEALLQRVVGAGRELEGALKEGTASVGHAAQTLRSAAGGVEGAVARLFELQAMFEQAGAKLDEGSGSLRKAITSLEEVAHGLRQHAEQLTETWEQQRARFEGLDQELTKAFSGMADGVHGTTQRVGQLLGQMDSNLSGAVKHLAGVVEELRELEEDIAEHVEALTTGERNGRA